MATVSTHMNDNISTWRFLDTGKGSAIFNMACDEVLLDSVENGESPPVLRLYQWEPAAISIGFAETPETLLDLGKCREEGVDVVRRLSGGRSVFHDRELTYSLIAPVDDPHFGGTLANSHEAVAEVICRGLQALGVDAVVQRPVKRIDSAHSVAKPCFMSISRSEISVGDRKLVGSAQRRYKQAFLQHGSILTAPGSDRIADYLKDVGDREGLRRCYQEQSIDIESETGAPVEMSRLKKALFEAFTACCAFDTGYSGLDKSEKKRVDDTMRNKMIFSGKRDSHE